MEKAVVSKREGAVKKVSIDFFCSSIFILKEKTKDKFLK